MSNNSKKKGGAAKRSIALILAVAVGYATGIGTGLLKDMPKKEVTGQSSISKISEPSSLEIQKPVVSEEPDGEDPDRTQPESEESSEAVETGGETVQGLSGDRKKAMAIMEEMTVHEKLCQMFVIFPESLAGEPSLTDGGERIQTAIQEWQVGGFIFDADNMESQEQVSGMLRDMQANSKIPFLMTCDEEGGRVNRLMNTVGTTHIGPMLDYKDRGTGTARSNARTIAVDMAELGFNIDMAPVADVMSNPENAVIGDRSYSTDFQQAAELVGAAVEGFHDGGIACTLKHFPGHGDTSEDSHYGAVYVYKTLDELREGELLPFEAGINAGADVVMAGHLIVTSIDDVPVPFSYKAVTGLLREEMGFDGVVMTDALRMQAISDSYSSSEAAVMAVQAGVDILLCPEDFEEAETGLENAFVHGEITEERLDESVLRILELKIKYGIIDSNE